MAEPQARVTPDIDVGVVVVAHNPGSRLADLCAVLSPQAPLLIVDNDSTTGADILAQCARMGAEIRRLERNEGVAGGLAEGHAHFGDREWILTFDQDSVIGPDFLTRLGAVPDIADPRVAMVGPTVVDADSGRPLQPASAGDARFLISSGALCRVAALDDVGGFRRELFIDHVDHDVCLRLRRRGWRLRVTGDVVMRHSIGAMREHRVAGGLSVRNSHHSADRQYYKYRNFVLLVRDGTALVDRGWVTRVGAALAWGPLKIALFEDGKAAKVRSALAGVRDGIRGVTGPRRGSPASTTHSRGDQGGGVDASSRPRALLICTPFFGYYEHIIKALEKRGYDVDHFNDRPSEKPLLKAVFRVRPRLVDTIVRNYLDDTLSRTTGRDYELILVVNGKALTPGFLARLTQDHPRAQRVLYLWDSIALYPNVVDLGPYFDRRFTFDSEDARARADFRLLPLFFSEDHRAVGDSTGNSATYDIVNVCTAHPNRYVLMKELIPRLRAGGLSVFSYLYLNPLQLVYGKLTSQAYAGAKLNEFNFRPMASSEYLEILRSAKAVLDVNHSLQTGLTIRTIETVGARRKLITTNTEVRKYPLYDPSRILVVEDQHVGTREVRDFIARPQQPLDEATYELYGIDAWLGELIEGDGSRHESVLDQ